MSRVTDLVGGQMLACWSLARFTKGRMFSSVRASEILYQCVCDLLLTESFLSHHWPCAQARHDVVVYHGNKL